MGNVRVYELAKELGIENKALLSRISELGIIANSHMTMLTPAEVGKIKSSLSSTPVGDVVEKRIKPTVIRRRSRRAKASEAAPEPTAESSAVTPTPEQPAPVSATEASPLTLEETPAPVQETAAEAADAPAEESATPAAIMPKKPVPDIGQLKLIRPPDPEDQAKLIATQRAKEARQAAQQARHQQQLAQRQAQQPGSAPPPIAPPGGPGDPAKVDKKRGARGKRVVYDRRRDSGPRRFVKNVDDLGIRQPRGKRKKTKSKRAEKTQVTLPKALKRIIKIDEAIMAGDLAQQMGIKYSELAAKLMALGLMPTITDRIDIETAELVTADFGFTVESVGFEIEQYLAHNEGETDESDKVRRSPVVTIMGHVDHGKTSLLDKIRKTQVAESEHGGITQHIGAYKVSTERGQLVFLDTPGHEAFTAMRARGASATDLVVLVVAADDGVMPQTVEAINHSQAAGVPIVVAVNKVDRPQANPEKVRQELTEHQLISEEWGGETIFCNVSAKTGEGIGTLLEMIALQSEMLELSSDPTIPAEGVIIESRLDRGKGPIATVLVQNGTLHKGEYLVSDMAWGRVRAMINENGEELKTAGPATPVEVWGLNGVPAAGQDIYIAKSERDAKAICGYRDRKNRERDLSKTSSRVSLEELMAQVQAGVVKDLNLVIKADVQGSVEALSDAFLKVTHPEIEVKVIHKAVGGINESDIDLAAASNAIVIGFNIRPEPASKIKAERDGVEIKLYNVIYDAIDDLKKAMEGMLEPQYEEETLGRAEVLQTFSVPKMGVIAGCSVRSGKIFRNSKARLVRDSVQVFKGHVGSLRRFKDDVREVVQGYECGIGLENFNDIKVGDFIEAYELKEVRQSID